MQKPPASPAEPWLERFLSAERLPAEYRQTIERIHRPLAAQIAARAAPVNSAGGCLTVGICGPQGSGKSTMTAALRALLEAQGMSVAVLSIDDLYLARSARTKLGREVHPLLLTRGVPGTHDVPLGLDVFAALTRHGTVALPSFDKSQDDLRPRDQWPRVETPVQAMILEGWCVGAKPQTAQALVTPINALERDEDRDGTWRRYANTALAGIYQQLFGQIDFLVLLKAPSFERVFRWRREQEVKLREKLRSEGADGARTMDDAALLRFISHYERLTRHILVEMPPRADLIVELDENRAMAVAPRR